MTLQDRVNQLLAKQARKKEGYKIFVNEEAIKLDKPLTSEDEVYAAIELILTDESIRPSIRVEDSDGKVIMNQDTSDDCNDDDSDDEYECCDEGQQKEIVEVLVEFLNEKGYDFDTVGTGYDATKQQNYAIIYFI